MGLIRPSFLDNMSWEMAEVYGAVTDQILINLASYFPYWKSGNVPKSAFEYQANMLAQMGQVNADTIKIIKNGLKGANKTLAGCLEQAVIEAVKKAQPELLKGVKSGILKPAGIPIVAPTQMRAFQLYYQQAAQKFNLVNTVMLESTKQAYQATVSDITNRVQATQTALDIGAGETVTGVSSWNQAVRHSIDRMKRDGITGFIDHGGHHWSAEAYTAMDIRTTVANTARSAVWETNQDFGNDLYLVSYHNGARPLCYPWQNKVISSTDNARIVTDLDGNEIPVWRQSDTSYGEPAGLFGINCKHYPSPFIPGVSLIRGEPQSPEENERTYEESQKQRALERKIREEKRDLLMMKAQGASEEEIKAQRAKIRQTDDDIDAFCDATGRARRQNREGVYTQRSFPDPDSYDPTTFEREQKETIEKYFSGGGSQTGYTFGQMTPNEPTEGTKYQFGELFDKQSEQKAKETIQMLEKEYPLGEQLSYVGDVRTIYGYDETTDLFDLSTEHPNLPDVGAQYYTAEMSPTGKPAIVIHNENASMQSMKDMFAEHSALRAKYPVITPETAFDYVGDGLQANIVHEYGHAIADYYGFHLHSTKQGSIYFDWLVNYWETHQTELLAMSKYAASNPGEMFAEAFLQVHDTEHKGTEAYRMASEIISEFRRMFIR